MADDSDDALIARLRAAKKEPVEKDPSPPHEKDDDPWDLTLVETGSLTLALLAVPLRVIRWVREKRQKPPEGVQEIRLMADYAPWPLWGRSGLLSEDDLPLSPQLKDRIKRWLNAYDQTPQVPGAGTWTPPLSDTAGDEEATWVAEGTEIRDAIQRELGSGYRVIYET